MIFLITSTNFSSLDRKEPQGIVRTAYLCSILRDVLGGLSLLGVLMCGNPEH